MTPPLRPMRVQDERALDAVRTAAGAMAGGNPAPGSALHLASFRVPESAVHDFVQHLFLRDPNTLLGATTGSPPPLGDLDRFLAEARDIIHDTVENYCSTELDAGTYRAVNLVPFFPDFEATLFQLFLANAAGILYELAGRITPGYSGSSGDVQLDVLHAFAEWLRVLVTNAQFQPDSLASSFDNPTLWINVAVQVEAIFNQLFPTAQIGTTIGIPANSYSFTPFPMGFVNFGLRLVFRQEWRPLGTQAGEIVRTIPLGPKQTEKVSVKVLTTQRESRNVETFTSTETSTEASNVSRESSDVVEEASSSLKWHVDAEASASIGFASGKISAGVAGENASSSKDSKSRLNETMQKTASKMRRDVKVIISTERSVTEEVTQSSEITNPNDEVAVTYVYSKLQRQYEIQTTLAEVNSVTYVPERVPKWGEITEEWLRRYDWILAKVMLDPSFAADLAELAREPADEDVADTTGLFQSAAEKAQNAIATYKDFKGGGELPDLFSSVQGGYERHLERKRGIAMNRARRTQRNQRLIVHVRENILHYMRAIWRSEDADQRLRRYARILVPTRWTFVPDNPVDPAHPELEVEGEFLPDYGPGSLRPLSEVINPAGPVGYCGNYAVYYLKSDPRLVALNGALAVLRAQYARFVVTVEPPAPEVRQAFVMAPRYARARYRVQRTGAGTWEVTHEASSVQVPATSEREDTTVRFDGLVLRFDPAPAVNTVYTVALEATGQLEDPELRVLRDENPLPEARKEAEFYTEALLRDLGTYLPEVGILFPADLSQGWDKLDDAAKAAVREGYHRYLLLKEHTRRFLLETNNLMIDLEVGTTPGLEEFKRLHRVVDVLKEVEETSRRMLENDRRWGRLAAQDFADPDIEQVTVVGGGAELTGLVGTVLAPATGAGAGSGSNGGES